VRRRHEAGPDRRLGHHRHSRSRPRRLLSEQFRRDQLKGTMADFRNVELNGSQRNATPYYVQLRVTALSSTLPPKDSDPAITFTAIDDRGQEQQSITFLGRSRAATTRFRRSSS
jgi:hypothetical protein